MNSLYSFCRGDSHISTEKPCQDYAYSENSEDLSMAIVSDGHGGERYFRSQYGSEFAVNVTKEAIRCFVETMHESTFNKEKKTSIFQGKEFTTYNVNSSSEKLDDNNIHEALRLLFSSIIFKWNQAITQHALDNELNDWEKSNVEEKYKKEFEANRQKEESSFEKTYGCTLMAYVQTPDYWFAFHIGDGKCITMQSKNGQLICQQPIPWDDRCFLNKTTSLCDTDAINEFRYCFAGDGSFPIAVFLGSDGLDDSYGDGENLINFYIQLYKIILLNGKDKALKELEKSLPVISQRGSKDDMSIATIFNDEDINSILLLLNAYQLIKVEDAFEETECQISMLQDKIEGFGNEETLELSQKINLQYAKNDFARAKEQAKRIKSKQTYLKGERTKFEDRIQSDNDDNTEDLSIIETESSNEE